MKHRLPVQPRNRRGVVLLLAAVCLAVMLVFAALCIDLGFICKARSEVQNCADAAALAAAGELYPTPRPQTAVKLPLALPIYQPIRPTPNVAPAYSQGKIAGAANRCAENHSLTLLDSDFSFGIYNNGVSVGPPPTLPVVDGLLAMLNLRTGDQTFVNSCEVVVRRDALANRPLNLFFAPALGRNFQTVHCSAKAAIDRGYGLGPGDKMLPFAMDITIWNALRFTNSEVSAVTLKPLGVDLDTTTLSGLLGSTGLLNVLNSVLPLSLMGSPIHVLDGHTYKRGMSTVTPGADGIDEVVLLADQLQVVNKLGLLGIILSSVQRIPSLVVSLETGAAGSAPDAARMNAVLRNGLTATDLQTLTGSSSGEMWLPFTAKGYFEIPDACEADLIAIIGQPRILPLYATLPGTVNKVTDVLGASHSFQLVGWGGVVITKVNLHGPVRYINLQPAIYARHSIRAATGSKSSLPSSYMSDGVFTSPRLVK
ncbi:pilus assembly protein TadG-related protein [Planctomicrobium sp. SH661]|uniref:pilus assembly protein TadG-related protein n=1 Tax=Planctomicrobium sp. SH661 TaxID=3448124 RepID=UPI003F5B1E07